MAAITECPCGRTVMQSILNVKTAPNAIKGLTGGGNVSRVYACGLRCGRASHTCTPTPTSSGKELDISVACGSCSWVACCAIGCLQCTEQHVAAFLHMQFHKPDHAPCAGLHVPAVNADMSPRSRNASISCPASAPTQLRRAQQPYNSNAITAFTPSRRQVVN